MSTASWLEEAMDLRPPGEPSSSPSLTHLAVGEVILSSYVMGPDKEVSKRVVEECLQRLVAALAQVHGFPQPEQGNFAPPTVEWLDWELQLPAMTSGWCGVFHVLLRAEDAQEGCWWKTEEYKRFARVWTDQVLEAFRVSTNVSGVLLDEKPFYWTIALDTQPAVSWTQENLEKHQQALTMLVRVRSQDAHCYTERAMRNILESNLAFTTEELQLMSPNTGFIYVAKSRLSKRDGLAYVRRALVDANALVRAMRAYIMRYRSETDRRMQTWMQRRVGSGPSRALLKELMHHARSAAEILRQLDELHLRMTRQVGHEQTAFETLLERYRIGLLVQDLHQHLSQLHSHIGELHSQLQARQLRWLNFLVVFPAAYQAWKLFQEAWPAISAWIARLSS
ncbi:MAG: hypothetical protein RMJ19_04525 [Gemmatales bacterium]|nr:hypothetical protein [Gemmatales bacterium]MCS7159716.1 hypothetical protein [Gemmatales bacterium]MDW8174914.1 hypothetical protein [Gemmatales bacterium]MDW8222812.1 hypothetical protein [Gemmatales bacterium]